ncbi:MAG: SCO family protein [Thiolinea sp.]
MLLDKTAHVIKMAGIFLSVSSLTYWGVSVIAGEASQHNINLTDHSQHQEMICASKEKSYERKQVKYQIPELTLLNQEGKSISTADLFSGSDPLMLNFIFTSCTTICPVLTATFAQLQKKLDKPIKMVSISIDPEYDTPARLKEYAQRFHAKENWTFLTGNLNVVIDVLNAFDAYRGDKMNHIPLTLIRFGGNQPWLRLEGFPGTNDLLKEYGLSMSELSGAQ